MITDFRLIYENIKINNTFVEETIVNSGFFYKKYENKKNFIYLCNTYNIQDIKSLFDEKIFKSHFCKLEENNILIYRYPSLDKIKIIYENNKLYLNDNRVATNCAPLLANFNHSNDFMIFVNKHVYSEQKLISKRKSKKNK